MPSRISQSTSCRRSNPPARVDKDLLDLNPDTSYRIECFHPHHVPGGCCHSSAELAACAEGLIKGITSAKAWKGMLLVSQICPHRTLLSIPKRVLRSAWKKPSELASDASDNRAVFRARPRRSL